MGGAVFDLVSDRWNGRRLVGCRRVTIGSPLETLRTSRSSRSQSCATAMQSSSMFDVHPSESSPGVQPSKSLSSGQAVLSVCFESVRWGTLHFFSWNSGARSSSLVGAEAAEVHDTPTLAPLSSKLFSLSQMLGKSPRWKCSRLGTSLLSRRTASDFGSSSGDSL